MEYWDDRPIAQMVQNVSFGAKFRRARRRRRPRMRPPARGARQALLNLRSRSADMLFMNESIYVYAIDSKGSMFAGMLADRAFQAYFQAYPCYRSPDIYRRSQRHGNANQST